MISTFLQGGLGNYMFQIAAGHSLALDNNTSSVFNMNGAVQVHKHISKYKDDIFRHISFGEVPNDKPVLNYIEQSFGYSPINITGNEDKHILLRGYFQSDKYFNHNRNEIISLFSPTPKIIDLIHEKYGQLVSLDNVCSIHVRRGDYVKLAEHHPPCEMSYYNEAMTKMPSDTTFLIFSDDIEWCKKNFVGEQFIFIEGESDVTDLWLMSYCKYNIIANSSFSWWGAWLNDNKNKIVVAPNKWFGSAKGNIRTDDIYANKWIKI